MKKVLLRGALLLYLGLVACQPGTRPPRPSSVVQGEAPPRVSVTVEARPATPAADESTVLLFTIGVHIEPMGTTAQGFTSGKMDYAHPRDFQRHVADLLALADVVEAHGGVMTIQAQSPFTTVAIAQGNSILADLAARGHEIGLHFHEDAHLGKDSERLSPDVWCAVMQEEIALIQQASGVAEVRYWSGGNLYPHLLEAASCAGLTINSDWKNPHTQTTDLSLVGVHPWRPAGSPNGDDVSMFARHDPDGPVIFLPEGLYDQSNFASMRRSAEAGGDQAYFNYLRTQLLASLAAAEPGKVNVFHFTVHPGEFRGGPDDVPFAVIDQFLSEVVDPLVATGQIQWATLGQMADAYRDWER